MTKTIPILLLALGLLAACDTTVIEGDTTVVIILGEDGRPDSVLVDGEAFPVDLPPGDGSPPADDAPLFDINRMVGAWTLSEAEPAGLGATSVTVTARLDLEVKSFGFDNLGSAFLVEDLGNFALPRCSAVFRIAAVTQFPWVFEDCDNLENLTVSATFEAVADTLYFAGSDASGLAELANRIAGVNLRLSGGAFRLKFVRSSRPCYYCR